MVNSFLIFAVSLGRRVIMCMLLIATAALIWNLLGQ
jgi:hypothetical protein